MPPDTVVLVPGLAIGHGYMQPLADALGSAFRVLVAPVNEEAPVGVPEVAGWLLEWLDARGVERFHLVGNSLGCDVAMEIAHRAPDRVGRVVLVAPAPDRTRGGLLAQALLLAWTALHEPLSLVLRFAVDALRNGPIRALRTIVRSLREASPVLRRVEAPVLVLYGGRDPMVSVRWIRRIAAVVGRAELRLLPDRVHVPHYEEPEAVARLLVPFLRGGGQSAGVA